MEISGLRPHKDTPWHHCGPRWALCLSHGPGAQILECAQIKEEWGALACLDVAHWPFVFPSCPRFQVTEKRVSALGL